jgi:hypothetical protein
MTKKNTSPNAEVEPSAETEVAEGTTDRLFGEEPIPEGVPEPKAVVEGQKATAPEPVAGPTETAPQYLDLKDLSGQKVKTKVDGVDGEVTIEELLKSYQTNETISQRGQELGTQRQALAGERKELDELKAKVEGMVNQGQVAQTVQASQLPADFDMLDEATKNILLAQQETHSNQMAEVTRTMQSLTASLQPLQVEQEFKAIDGILKTEKNPNGESIYTDFMGRIGEVESAIMALPVERQAEYSTRLGYMNIYKDIKAREWQGANSGTPPEAALIPRIEGGAGAPTGLDGDASKLATLRKKAMDASALKDVREGIQPDPVRAWADYMNG